MTSEFEKANEAFKHFAEVCSGNYTPNEQRRAIGLKPIEHQCERYEPLICSQCGGQIDRDTMKCLYCLTEYETPKKDTVKVYIDDRIISESEVR